MSNTGVTTKLVNGKPPRPQLGLVPGRVFERALIGFIYLAVIVLQLLSVFGTFYGLRGQPGPLAAPWTMPFDAAAAPVAFGWALLLQAVLTLFQWGGRQLAKRDPRWWLMYLAALALSVYYNLVAYYGPAVDLGVPWFLAFVLILGGDVAPENAMVRDA